MASSSYAAGQPNYALRNDSEGLGIAPGAFDALIPNASKFGASSSGTKHISYDIFINHCGQDTKQTLATGIYESLDATGLRVFLDKDELKLGDLLPKALEEAMASASICIAIFSEHYARSAWCLAELEYMVKTRKTIIPIFYHIDPSVLIWAEGEKGEYADAFSDHEEKGRYTPEVLQQWRKALQEVSYCIDRIIENNKQGEQMAVKNVVNRVMKEMKVVPLEVAKYPVGLDEIVQDFDDTIALEFAGLIHTVGIWGLGGSGKTTLAKEIFNKRCSAMDKSSFLFDLREANLVDKQKRLLKDLGVKDLSFDNVDKGKQIMEKSLSKSVSVLIVLDDVNHLDQLDALIPPIGDKSLIIVTTRDANVLQQCGISAIYQMKPLKANHAKELFCWHAFLRNSPPSELMDLVEMFINACQGLPLSLKVLSGQLYGKSDKDYWQRTFNLFSQIPHTEIKNRLKVSYDALEKQEQEMFLDTACLFIGERKTQAIAAWDAEENWDGLLGWETLFNKCLVEEDENGLIRMHDRLRDLGRDIANGQSPHRLWSPQQVIEISPQEEPGVRGMTNAAGKNCYQRQGKIIINTSQGERSLTPSSLGLKFFLGNGEFLNQEHSELSRELIWLQCNKFEHKNLPSWLGLKNLRILQLSDSRSLEYLWERDSDSPSQLREMVIQRCKSLRGFPRSIGHLKNLKKILINDDDRDSCFALNGLPQEFCSLQSLEHLEVRHCPNLSSLPSDFGNLTNLQHLYLMNLSSLPSNFGNLTNLRHLHLRSCTMLEELPDTFKKLTLLEYLNLEFCQKLNKLHVLENMSKLRYLNLEGCWKLEVLQLPEVASLTELRLIGNGLKELPANIFELTTLTKLEIGSEIFTKLPNCVENLSPLTTLTIKECRKLKSLPDSLEHLNLLRYLTIENTGVKNLPKSLIHLQSLTINDSPISELSFGLRSKLKSIYLGSTEVSKISISEDCCPVLETLELHFNNNLRELETLPGTLKTLIVQCCTELKNIRGVRGLKEIKILELHTSLELEEVPCFPELVSLEVFKLAIPLNELPSFQKFTSLKVLVLLMCLKLEKVEGLQHLKLLEKLDINCCRDLEVVQGLAELLSLKEFHLAFCVKLEKIEGLENIRSLKKLMINNCSNLDMLPSLTNLTSLREFDLTTCHKLKKIEGLENITSLEELKIIDCPELEVLATILETTSLKTFQLEKYHKLKKIEGIENIISLEKLKIYDCSELDGLPSLAQLDSLKEFDLKSCHNLEKIEDLEIIRSLEKFKISYCPKLEVLPSLPETTSLKQFQLEKCEKLKKIKGLENIRSLEKLRVYGCAELDGLPGLAKLTSLKEIDLQMCSKLVKMDGLENIRSLKKLNISDCPELEAILCLPETTSLKKFQLRKCHKLKSIKGLENIRSLEMLRVYDCAELDGLPGLTELTSLKELDLQMCHKLDKMDSLENLRSLEKLKLSNYQGLDGLPNLPETASLKEIQLKNCLKLEKIDGLGNKRLLEKLGVYDCPELDGLPGLGELTSLKEIDLQMCQKLEKIDGLENIRSLEKLKISDCLNLVGLLSLAELPSLKEFRLGRCPKLEKLRIYDCPQFYGVRGLLDLANFTSLKGFALERCPKLLALSISNCQQLDGLNLAELTSFIRINLERCPKLKKIEGLENIRSLWRLEISDCSELEALPSLSEIASLRELQLKKCYKLEKIKGLERLRLLEKLEVHTRWNAPCIVSLDYSERLKSLVVVANHISAAEPFFSNLQKWPSEVKICTRVFDVGLLKRFFENFPNVSVLDYSDTVEVGSSHGGKRLELRRPQSSANANAILRCFIIDSDHPELLFSTFGSELEPVVGFCKDQSMSDGFASIRREWRSTLDPFNTELESALDSLDTEFGEERYFHTELLSMVDSLTELGKGKWVWMGVSTPGMKDYIYAMNSKGEDVDVKVEAAWLVMGEPLSVVDAFLHLFPRPNQGVRDRRCWIGDKGLCTCSHKAAKRLKELDHHSRTSKGIH